MCASSRRAFLGVCLCAAGLPLTQAAQAAHDDEEGYHDHDRARRAVERGEAKPLSDILLQVRPALGGEVAGVAFHRNAGRWVYEFRVIAAGGQMTEVYVDAGTAEILKREVH